jgi:DNA-binding NtrC family response regulator
MSEIKVVILEDTKADARLIQQELKKSPINFVSAVVGTKKQFENAIRDFCPDLILSDYSLPSFDGVSAFRMAQKLTDAPFIIVSGTIGEEKAVELIKDGVTDYVLKDKLFTLTHKIERALKEKDERDVKRDTDERLKIQNKKLFEISFLQSHQVRVPVAHIMGLFGLFDFNNAHNPINGEVLTELKVAAESLDIIIHEIVRKTDQFTDAEKAGFIVSEN